MSSPLRQHPEPGNRFRFRFVFVSCVRAGEAKLRGRARGVPPQRWASGSKILRLLAGTFRVKVTVFRVGFKLFLPNSFSSEVASQCVS